jgi:hypothetical protein
LPTAYAFALMARLYPRVDALRVLTTADALDLVPNALVVVFGLVAFLARLSPLQMYRRVTRHALHDGARRRGRGRRSAAP